MKHWLTGILLIAGLLYFTNAGTWLWVKVKDLDKNCYSVLMDVSAAVADPLCGAVAKGIGGIDNAGTYVSGWMDKWRQRLAGSTDLSMLDTLADRVREEVSRMASSRDRLSQMMSEGPRTFRYVSAREQLQQAIDSFAIGQMYLQDGSDTGQAMEWFQQGAAQPQGFGLMSQLTLGNLYLQGNQSVPANPHAAKVYLQQARSSIDLLSSNDSPEAKQLLQSLPSSPQVIRNQLDRVLREIKYISSAPAKQ